MAGTPASDSTERAERDELAAVGSLAEPTRRTLYEHVARHGGWVSRDGAAEAVGIERGTAAHHLERLASDGLLDVDYQRLTGRRGPGAGRPAKVYRRAEREFEVSLPPREYELAARLLAEAADRSRARHDDITTALASVSATEGRGLAKQIRDRLRSAAGRAPDRRRALLESIAELGYEPNARDDGTVILRNCPFHHLATRHTELICGMNHSLLRAAVDEVGMTGLRAELAPEEGLCCVKLVPVP